MPRKRLAEAENPSRDLAVENRARLTPALSARRSWSAPSEG